MSSLSSILATATSGMLTAQTGLSTVSDNIANVSTPGYVRKIMDPTALVSQGVGTGVSATAVVRAANQYLQSASLSAAGSAGQSSIVSNLLDQAQALFGDPTSTTNYFSTLNSVFNSFAAAANDPSSSLTRTQVLNQVGQFLNQSQSISSSLSGLQSQADSRISADVGQVNQLLSQIGSLNSDITHATSIGADASNSQNAQSELLNKLSSLIDVQVSTASNGAINVRTTNGVLLAGVGGAATLTYQPNANSEGQIVATQAGGNAPPTDLKVSSGEIGGLLSLRGTQLPALSAQFGEFVSQTVNAINQAHNNASSVPPPATLTGQNTGLDQASAFNNFTGKASVAIVDANGNVQQQVNIDFSLGTMTSIPGGSSNFTPGTFATALTGALGNAGTASFNNGVLSIAAAGAGNGVTVSDDATTPSSKAGRDFSQYFGLNNLITSSGISNYQTGLTAADTNDLADPNNVGNGGSITLRVAGSDGSRIHDINITLPSGGTVQGVLDALNSPTSGVGLYGQFALDANGGLGFTPSSPGSASITVLSDQTQWGVGGPTVTQLFGIGAAQGASRATSFSVRSDIAADPSKLALAQVNLNAAPGQPVLLSGDNSGALKLARAGDTPITFNAAGPAATQTTTVNNYAAQMSGQIGQTASNADQAASNATAVQSEADTRRQSAEGVNLDQELVNLTTYQQAYSSSARLIQATTDLFAALMAVVP